MLRNSQNDQYADSRRYCNTTTKNHHGSQRNYGEILYKRGMKRKAEMQKLVLKAKSEQDRQELESHSF